MADPAPTKPFKDFELKEAAEIVTGASDSGNVAAPLESAAPERAHSVAGGANDRQDPQGSQGAEFTAAGDKAGLESSSDHACLPAGMMPGADVENTGLYHKNEYQGLRRHRLIVGSCLLLALGIFALSAFDLKPLLSTDGHLDKNLHFTADPKPPKLDPSLVYENGASASEGLYRVRENAWYTGKIGLVDTSGKLAVRPKFVTLGDFHEGLAQASTRNGKYGFIDKTGRFVIPAHYDGVFDFKDGVAAVSKPHYGYLIDKSGNVLFTSEKNPVLIQRTPRVPNNQFDGEDTENASGEDQTNATTGENRSGGDDKDQLKDDDKTADYDKNKEADADNDSDSALTYQPPQDARRFDRYGNVFIVYTAQGKAGLLNSQGKWVVPPSFDEIIPLLPDDITGYMIKGNPQPSEGAGLGETVDFQFRKDGLWGILDRSGKVLIEPKYKEILSYENGHAAVKVGKKYGFVDRQGQFTIKPEYDFVTTYDKLIAVENNKIWKFIDSSGRPVNIPNVDGVIHAQDGHWFSDGLGPVMSKKKVGFIKKNGQFAIQPQYDWAFAFNGGFAPVWNGFAWHFINKIGQRMSPDFADTQSLIGGTAPATVPGPLYPLTEYSDISNNKNYVTGWIRRYQNGKPHDHRPTLQQ